MHGAQEPVDVAQEQVETSDASMAHAAQVPPRGKRTMDRGVEGSSDVGPSSALQQSTLDGLPAVRTHAVVAAVPLRVHQNLASCHISNPVLCGAWD